MAFLLVDNYDSFTYNLYQLLARVTGEAPRVIRNDAPWSEVLGTPFEAVVLSPGPGRPEVERDFGLCARIIEEIRLPILGVCLGHQGIGASFGARVEAAPEVVHGRSSQIFHADDPLFANLPSPFEAIRYHSLMVTDLPEELVETAWTEDGIIMGLRHRERPIWGVQFHPESIGAADGHVLVKNFADQVSENREANLSTRGVTGPSPTHSTESCAEPQRVLSRNLGRWIDPERVFVGRFSQQPHCWWLDSNDEAQSGDRVSFMGAAEGPDAEVATYDVGRGVVRVARGDVIEERAESIFSWLGRRLRSGRPDASDIPFDLCGGYVGYLGYELKAECGGDLAHASPLPDAHFVSAHRFVAFDHQRQEVWLVALSNEANTSDARRWLSEFEAGLADLPTLESAPAPQERTSLRLGRPRKQYLADIDACFDALTRGESYEICLTTQLVGEAIEDPLGYYRSLRKMNPAPYSAFLSLGDTSVACSSPERFLRIDGAGRVEARPIKGTRPRGVDEADDAAMAAELATAEKDRAENLMIVDLLRNDLGRVCRTGTVHVPELMVVETYATVHQLVSSVQGNLRAGLDAVDCVRSAFPAGSMTGAPKLRTMEIIDGLEGEARGIYSGAIGYFSALGAADFNVVIRTAVCEPERVTVGVGGAIVSLSDPASEVEEILLKGRVLAQAMGSQIES